MFICVCYTGTNYLPSGVTGCIARWTFDTQEGGTLTTITDQSGNGNHGSNINITPSVSWRGVANKSGSFNGYSSYSQVPTNTNLNCSTITVVALVKFTGFYSGNCQGNNIVYRGFDYNADLNWALYTTDANYDNSCLVYSPNYNKANFVTPNHINTGVPLVDFIQANKWYLLMATFNGTTIDYYQIPMDSTNKLSSVSPSYSIANNKPIANGNFPVFLGSTQNPPFPYWFNGQMDEVILFNRVLSKAELYSVYDYLWGTNTPNSIATTGIEQDYQLYTNSKTIKVIPNKTKKYDVRVTDIIGSLIYHKISMSGVSTIDLSSMPTSIYFVQISEQCTMNKREWFTKKVAIN